MSEVDEVDDRICDDCSGSNRRKRRTSEQRFKQRRQRRLSDNPDSDTGRRDSDLAGSQIQFEVLSHLPGPFEFGVTVDEFVLRELPGTCQRELDGDEESVREDEQYTGGQANGDLGWIH